MMKSVILSRPCSMFLTCLIITAFSLQIGSGAVNTILAKSPEPKAKSAPANSLPVAYRSIIIKGGEGPKVLSQLKSEIGEEKMAALLKLNRLDAQHLRAGATILIPEQIDKLDAYSPFPQ